MTIGRQVTEPIAEQIGPWYRERFWALVERTETCWLWRGAPDEHGYGRATWAGRKTMLAHRLSWVLNRGPIPEGSCVLHRCDVPGCVNPDHLFLGDRGDNARDMAAKGRQWVQRSPERALRGTSHGNARLNDDAIREIRRRRAAGEVLHSIGASFGISATTISLIVRRKAWTHVEDAR